jgi:two-component system chemotaxis response regulator CheB
MSFEIAVIGASLGGLRALGQLLSGLPDNFPLPVAIVQHRVVESGGGLCAALQKHCRLIVKEAHDKEPIAPGRVYLAPSDYHLLVDRWRFALSTEAPVLHARPSIDVLFESAAYAYRERVVGVLLTGASHDGAQGLARIKERGGRTIVQDPSTAESSVMPLAAIAAARVDHILPPAAIAAFLIDIASHVEVKDARRSAS